MGFTATDAALIVEAIVQIQSQKAKSHLASLREVDPALWTMLPAFELKVDDIISGTGLPGAIVTSFLEAFTCDVQLKNKAFRSITDFNLTSVKPIILLEGRHFLFQYVSLMEALYESPAHWMYQDVAYRATASLNKGGFTEEMAFEYLRKIFGEAHVFQNLDLYNGASKVGEIDVYISFGEIGIICQCKSKKLTAAARSGNLTKIQEDFQGAIQDSYTQCRVCFDGLQAPDIVARDVAGNVVTLQKPERVFPITVIAQHYPALSVQVPEFLKTSSASGFENPLCIDLFTLDVLAELVPSPIRVLAYLE